MRNLILTGLLAIIVLAGCESKEEPYFREIAYYFNDKLQGWTGVISDYPQGEEDSSDFEFGLKKLPLPLDTSLYAVKISSNNQRGGLFTYMFAPVSSLASNATYSITFNIQLASNISTSTIAGPEGSPNIAIGAGALDTVPVNVLDDTNWYRPNFEVKLQNKESTEVMQVLGNLGVTDGTTAYTAIGRNNYANPIKVKSNNEGKIYLLIGWDSGYKGVTAIYIKTVIVRLEYLKEP
jgi:hypothetical protein